MKPFPAAILLVLSAADLPIARYEQQPAVRGIVVDSASGKPLPEARIVAYPSTVLFVDSVAVLDSAVSSSDSAGAFIFESLRPDAYAAWVRAPFGWCSRWLHFVVSDSGTVRVRVALLGAIQEGDYIHC